MSENKDHLFKPGNKFWQIRSKHGRDKLFATPELLWEAACEYFEWCDNNPFKKQEAKVVSKGGSEGSKIEIVETEVIRPYTIHGLCGYLHCNTDYFRTFKSQQRLNKEDFSTVIKLIEDTIYNQKFSGASAGFLKENIIARDLGLADKQEHRTDEKITVVIREEHEPDGDQPSATEEDNK